MTRDGLSKNYRSFYDGHKFKRVSKVFKKKGRKEKGKKGGGDPGKKDKTNLGLDAFEICNTNHLKIQRRLDLLLIHCNR